MRQASHDIAALEKAERLTAAHREDLDLDMSPAFERGQNSRQQTGVVDARRGGDAQCGERWPVRTRCG